MYVGSGRGMRTMEEEEEQEQQQQDPTPLGLWPGGSAAVHLGASLLCVLIFGLPSAAARVGRFLTIPFAPGTLQ
jgi:hypothetical protein